MRILRQDKTELVEVNHIRLGSSNSAEWIMLSCTADGLREVKLGTYKDKEECLEVMEYLASVPSHLTAIMPESKEIASQSSNDK